MPVMSITVCGDGSEVLRWGSVCAVVDWSACDGRRYIICVFEEVFLLVLNLALFSFPLYWECSGGRDQTTPFFRRLSTPFRFVALKHSRRCVCVLFFVVL